MEKFGLSQRNIKIIIDILAKYPEIESAIIYGSRAKGNYRIGSDIDLTFKGKNLTDKTLSRIWHDLDDSDSPYLFDLSIYHHLTHQPFIDHIDRVGKIFYQREDK
ncbi:nucleotidyltransferase domain-containing protein [Pasteurella oralis]|uniref:Nucleotidyltransferase domain-containing protein n=1 Tax=Pasteurella oralis TaxID=1071947 RepID=A0ABW4NVB9_9PAST|nr:nucleotidyltransferase domain-containing protein [Pasteurella oralis]MDO5054256.1 nucleotidyltransferase domain-containing protein [Pasteurella oralis]